MFARKLRERINVLERENNLLKDKNAVLSKLNNELLHPKSDAKGRFVKN